MYLTLLLLSHLSSLLFLTHAAKPSLDPSAALTVAAAGHPEGDRTGRSKDSWDLSEPGHEDVPLIIASNEELTGEDEEITGAFSGC